MNSFQCQQQIKWERYRGVIFEIAREAVESILIPYPQDEKTHNAIHETRKNSIGIKSEKLREASKLKGEAEVVMAQAEQEILKLVGGERRQVVLL